MIDDHDNYTLAQRVGQTLTDIDRKLMALLGLELVSIEPGRAVVQMRVREDMVNGQRYCHGGLLFTLADHAFAYACMAGNQKGVTQSAHVIYSNPAQLNDLLTATATVTLDNGGRTATSDVVVVNQRGEIVAQYRGINYRVNAPVVEK